MKKRVLILIPFVLKTSLCEAQKVDPASRNVEKCMQEYMQLSRLGPGYSRVVSADIIDQFNALFERDAFLYWDLYRSARDSLLPPLPVGEYVDLAKKIYQLKQPLLDYSGMKITVQQDEKKAVVSLEKTNQVMDPDDQPLFKNKVRLLVQINLDRAHPLIQNIFEDKRNSLVRSLSIGINYMPWSNVLNSVTHKPVIRVGSNEQIGEFSMTAGIPFQVGGMMEMRLNRDHRDGILFCAGIFYSQIPLFSVMNDYSNSFPDTLGESSGNPLACTTFERSPQVREKIVVKKIEIPLLLKSYLNDWIYLKAGTALCFVTGTADINYLLSRTGGGLITNLSTHEQYYLEKDHELDQKDYGYYRNKNYHFPKDRFLDKMILSFQLAAGFEKQFNYFTFGFEPNVSFGMNPFSKRSLPGNYELNTIKGFHSIIESVKIPAFEFAFGIRVLISYVFKN